MMQTGHGGAAARQSKPRSRRPCRTLVATIADVADATETLWSGERRRRTIIRAILAGAATVTITSPS